MSIDASIISQAKGRVNSTGFKIDVSGGQVSSKWFPGSMTSGICHCPINQPKEWFVAREAEFQITGHNSAFGANKKIAH